MSEIETTPLRAADGGISEPSELPVGAATDRFLTKRRTDSTDRTLRSYRSRLSAFEDWCTSHGIETVGELTPFHIDQYDMHCRERDLAPTTLKGHLSTLHVFLQYLADIDAVDDAVAAAVDVPTLSRQEQQSEERLAPADAERALSFFRDSRTYFGTGMHAFLELAWHTGARMGSLRGLDLSDYSSDEQYVRFQHRPATDTPLKNKTEGERYVGLSTAVCEALDTYIARERSDKRDDAGRQPLFAGRQGRQSFSTLRAWSYQATQPCLWTECPHGKRRVTCTWTERDSCSKCPSSRSPHRIRTGSITWQLNQGLSIETVATRVNASPSVIRKHYDQASGAEEFEERRQQVETTLDIDQESNS